MDMKEEDGLRILVCFIVGFMLVIVGIGALPFGFLLTVAGIFVIIYGFSPETAEDIINRLGDIAEAFLKRR